ncbi:MAG: hypothetical protein WBB45_14775 [Cyclobacteriaceae bacterium]
MKHKKLKLSDLEIQSFRTEYKDIRAGFALKEPRETEPDYPDCGKTGLLVDPNCQH